jgi:hypothetical protein
MGFAGRKNSFLNSPPAPLLKKEGSYICVLHLIRAQYCSLPLKRERAGDRVLFHQEFSILHFQLNQK